MRNNILDCIKNLCKICCGLPNTIIINKAEFILPMKLKNLIVRNANIGDIKSIAKLGLQFLDVHSKYSPLDELNGKRTLAKEINQWRKFLKDKSYFVMVAEINGNIVGFMTLKIVERDKMYKTRKLGEIEAVIVNKRYTYRGYGRALFAHALKFLKSKNIGIVNINVRVGNPAISLAKKVGFKEYDTRLYKMI